MSAAHPDTTPAGWLRRWDAQQQMHIPDREDRFRAIVDALEAFAGARPQVLDLGCGPGSLSARVLDRLPGATVLAIDADPVLLGIGRAALGDRPGLTFVDADLRGEWVARLPAPGPFDAAVSTTALHWLELHHLVRFYGTLARVLRPGGVFLDGDRFDFDHDQGTLAAIAATVQPNWPATPDGVEDYAAWWEAAVAEPAFAEAVAERARRGHDHPHDSHGHSYEFHRAALLAAGVTEVGTLWQRMVNRVLVAIR